MEPPRLQPERMEVQQPGSDAQPPRQRPFPHLAARQTRCSRSPPHALPRRFSHRRRDRIKGCALPYTLYLWLLPRFTFSSTFSYRRTEHVPTLQRFWKALKEDR